MKNKMVGYIEKDVFGIGGGGGGKKKKIYKKRKGKIGNTN
jgi:hypothetical protein